MQPPKKIAENIVVEKGEKAIFWDDEIDYQNVMVYAGLNPLGGEYKYIAIEHPYKVPSVYVYKNMAAIVPL